MILNKNILAVIPARGGSKGIPLKNLRTINGVSLVAIVGKVLGSVPEVDHAVVSTDHDEIARIAESVGISAPFRRPQNLSGDRISDLDVLTHALMVTEELDDVIYDVVVMLQPTSPLRKAKHVSDTIHMLIDGGWDSVWTVSETDSKSHPLKQLVVDEGRIEYYEAAGKEIIARQQLNPVYHRNGIAYAVTRRCLLEKKSIKGDRAGANIIKGDYVSIDTEWDLDLTEFILSRKENL
jgi:CMP-N,N'-diacetyllegionaminic acid synthase